MVASKKWGLLASATDQAVEAPAQRDHRRIGKQQATDAGPWPWLEAGPAKLAAALFFGVVFGFLLQKGGVARFDILAGVLLLENFVVVKVMLSAIIVGMIGTYVLRKFGVVDLVISETRYGANVVGGLIFGVGFGLLAYCPGTNAAALGQGNLDALVGVAGLMLGSYAFALVSRYSSGRVSRWGNRGKITLPDVFHARPATLVPVAAMLLAGVLVLLELFGP